MKWSPRPVADQEHLVPLVLLKIGCFKVWQTICLDLHGTEVMVWACFENTHILERFKLLVTFFHIWRTSLFVMHPQAADQIILCFYVHTEREGGLVGGD